MWRKSGHSTLSNCVEAASWRKSTASGSVGDCVEAGDGPGVVGVRDSQDPDGGRLEVDSSSGRFVVELAFDASGRIGTARWLTPAEASQPQEQRERTAT